ncbi:zinc-binding alcohol dehydrogenase family protein [Aeromicrobium sp. CTD01-1L150]|uniref:quinone oxidoreductase family protein n=1 Tax=Aeromicrobium sp. CTD01-1L150 TaxID=3341830 RepID=UPI0035C0898D
MQLSHSSINFHDVLVRQSGRGLALPRILGSDGCGIDTSSGELVVIDPSIGWGPREEVSGAGFSVRGDHEHGTYAELTSVDSSEIQPKPPHLSNAEAAALPLAGVTAYRALFVRGRAQPGQMVLVTGASSGVAVAALQFALAAGMQPLVTSSKDDRLSAAVAEGAVDGVNYTDPRWPSRVKEMTDGGVDLILDGAGANLAELIDALRPGGRIVLFGMSAGQHAKISIPQVFFKQIDVVGTTTGSPQDFKNMLDFVTEHGLCPRIQTVIPLENAADAHRLMESRTHVGKIVLEHS